MWWKLALATLVGIAIGITAATTTFYLSHAAVRDTRAGYLPGGWSSTAKEWSKFADWLRHGGRRLLLDAALSAAHNGMSENEVRASFGPPDLVVARPSEFKAYSAAQMKGAEGAYFYKIGQFAQVPNRLGHEVFAVVFDPSGKVIYRLGFGVRDGDKLANIDADTRSEQRVAP